MFSQGHGDDEDFDPAEEADSVVVLEEFSVLGCEASRCSDICDILSRLGGMPEFFELAEYLLMAFSQRISATLNMVLVPL